MKSVIFGANGQDGSYLFELLLKKGYRVIGVVRRSSTNNLKWIQDIKNDLFDIVYGDITDASFVNKIMKEEQFDYCYNMSAMSHVGISFDIPQYTMNVNCIGVLNALEAIRLFSPQTKFLQCSTSEMLAHNNQVSNEQTPFETHSPYAVSKLAAHWLVRIYREAYGLFACCSICYNHESPRRSDNFVTQKIVKNLVKMKKGLIRSFELGNIEAKRDWGFAGDYVEAMWLMLQQEKPDDYVIATDESHSVRELIQECCWQLNLDTKYIYEKDKNEPLTCIFSDNHKIIGHVIFNPNNKRPWDVNYLRGDYSKAKRELGWEPKVRFKELIKMMIEAELKRYEK